MKPVATSDITMPRTSQPSAAEAGESGGGGGSGALPLAWQDFKSSIFYIADVLAI